MGENKMNIKEKIRILLNKTIDYDSRILKPNFVSELTALIQQEREKAVREFVTENYQPKNTSTDIEEIYKKFNELFYEGKENCVMCRKHKLYATPTEIINFVNSTVSHLSNKSELKKEAVRGFAKWLDLDTEAVYKMPHFMQEWAEEYLSSNEKEVLSKEMGR